MTRIPHVTFLALCLFGAACTEGFDEDAESTQLALGCCGSGTAGGGSTSIFGDRPNNGPFLLAHAGIETDPYFPSNHPSVQAGATLQGESGIVSVIIDGSGVAGLEFASDASDATGNKLIGTQLKDSQGSVLSILDAEVFTSLSGPQQKPFSYMAYEVSKNGAPLCSGDNVAIAIPGVFDGSATLVGGSEKFSFACALGAAAKCVNLGFAPRIASGAGITGDTDSFLACERMLRFELEQGTSATLFNTQLDVLDDANVLTRQEAWVVEAAWTRDGPLCLSRARWSSLPIGYAGLADPRVDGNAIFCDKFIPENLDSISPTLSNMGIRMVSFSNITDDALLSWRKLGTTGNSPHHYVTTTQGNYSPLYGTVAPPGTDPDVEPLFEGVALRSTNGYGAPLVPLYKYYPGGKVSTHANLFGFRVRIGFISPTAPLFNGLELGLFRSGTQYHATTRHPAKIGVPQTAGEYVQGYLLGWP